MARKVKAKTVLYILVFGGLALVALALLAGKPKLAFAIALVDPVLPP